MGIFSNIKDAIFGKAKPAAAVVAPAPVAVEDTASAAAAQAAADQAAAAPVAISEVDVEAILNDLVESSGQKLNWRSSIVDLMKLLDMDSSLAQRKALADELGFDGDTDDSASMNIWLHKQVMVKLAENGGTVPDDLLG